ncbi:hypothetical protein SUGI_0813710 [Cryptomeria japonica]|nr:hypothetical protein SUGI_0813710 [Cryptomeria japonica]
MSLRRSRSQGVRVFGGGDDGEEADEGEGDTKKYGVDPKMCSLLRIFVFFMLSTFVLPPLFSLLWLGVGVQLLPFCLVLGLFIEASLHVLLQVANSVRVHFWVLVFSCYGLQSLFGVFLFWALL